MSKPTHEDGVIVALLDRFRKQRLPRLIGIKERVDGGETLTDDDIEFLEDVLKTANEVQPLVERHPEFEGLVAKAIHLFHDITEKALENEKSK